MNTANWIPDEFMRRVETGGQWTLFSPDEVPDLHDLYGNDFATRYAAYEAAADRGEIGVFRRVDAVDLWRRMLTVLFETGHPWITFKDPCDLRSPQQRVRSSPPTTCWSARSSTTPNVEPASNPHPAPRTIRRCVSVADQRRTRTSFHFEMS